MVKRILFSLIMMCSALSVFSQRITVSGRILDGVGEPIDMATVQILSLPDSAYVNGCVSNSRGYFTLPSVKAGSYVVKFSFVGYESKVQAVNLAATRTQVNLGTIKLEENAVLLKEAVVTAQAAQVEVKEDTIQYNVSAYRVPEGSALEELVKKIPGAEVSEDGKITLNGKDITKILVNGKEFFSGDTQVAMKNLTVDMVDKIKAYDKKSDLARVTGIDDGEEEAVIDLTVKKGMDQGIFGNADLGGGTESRWVGKAMVNHFADKKQFSLMANLNNVNDQGFPGGGGGFRMGGNNGLTTRRMFGGNFAFENKKVEMGGNLRFQHDDTDTQSKSSTYTTASGNYGNSLSKSLGHRLSLNFDGRLEWKPDSLTNLIFRPRASMSRNRNNSNSRSITATEDTNPYMETINEFFGSSLSGIDLRNILSNNEKLALALLNAQSSQSHNDTDSENASGELQFNRKFGSEGRNITLRVTGGYTNGDNENFSYNDQFYFISSTNAEDSNNLIRRYSKTPTTSWNYSGQLTYSEPIARATYLQFSYRFSRNYSENDRNTYDLSEVMGDNPIGYLPVGWESYRDKTLSKYVENTYDLHNLGLTLRIIRSKWQLNLGATYQPQHSVTNYQQGEYMDRMGTFTRNVNNFSPTLDYRYNFSRMSRLRIRYRVQTSQPSVSNLLPVIDNSNPLSISMGNPSLRPSLTNRFEINYNTFLPESQTGIMTMMNIRTTSNSVSSKTTYFTNGGNLSMPENIDGNWNAMGILNFNTAFKDKRFTINTFTRASFNNYVSYYTDRNTKVEDKYDFTRNDLIFDEVHNYYSSVEAQKNVTKNLVLGERLSLAFRSDLFDVAVNGNVEYNNMKNKLLPSSNSNTWNFSYGINGNLNLPWNMSLSTDLTNSSRRGYSDDSYNTNELVWNAQISQNFLKGNALTLQLQFFDILKKQSNVSRMISAMMSSDTEYNAINSYAMLHVTYRLNIMGNRDARERMRGRGGFGGGFPPGGGFGSGRGGRGGFGRPD